MEGRKNCTRGGKGGREGGKDEKLKNVGMDGWIGQGREGKGREGKGRKKGKEEEKKRKKEKKTRQKR